MRVDPTVSEVTVVVVDGMVVVEDFLKGVLVGTINLKPLTYSITSAAPEAS